MRFSEKWLREWVNPQMSTDELSHRITMAGLEVDAVEPVAGVFSGVVVGEVIEVVPHPDADKLRVCKVNVGQAEPLGIVCGAANVRVGMRAPTAVIGAELPGGLKIKAAKLRGVPSSGMLCSAKELGLAEASQGLMELPADAPVGVDLRAWLELDDVAIELGLTPNRGDCLGIEGLAREVAAVTGAPLRGPAIDPVDAAIEETFPVALGAPEACPRYVGRVIRNVNPQAKTPLWMQERLRRCGLRPLSPLVDVTNYVLLELGQPMHAFDLSKLREGIVVREAKAGERLELLNGSTVELQQGTLVIADASGPVAMAGIMGGALTAVDDATTRIFLESAFFSPAAMAGRARRYGLHTDSSHRFERGVSHELQRRAIERATALIVAITGGEAGPVLEVVDRDHLPGRAPIRLRHARLCAILGADIPAPEVTAILTRLGMEPREEEAGWHVVPPAHRFDIAIEEDLVEEVARLYGYDRLPSVPLTAALEAVPRSEAQLSLRRLRQVLVNRGYQEAITYSFVDPVLQSQLDPEMAPIPVANPISAELSVMRTTLWAGLIPALVHNANRQADRVRLFETGLRFIREGSETRQEPMLAGIAWGTVSPEQWGEPSRAVDFFDVKGDLEALTAAGGAAHVWALVAGSHPALHPGQTARIMREGGPVGWIGSVHPRLAKALDLPGRVVMFEIELSALLAGQIPKFRELSKFPAIRRDIAVVVGEDVTAEAIRSCVLRAAPPFLRQLKLFDVYQGKGLDSRQKSVALGLTLQDDSRTLTDAEVDAAVAQVLAALGSELGGSLRE